MQNITESEFEREVAALKSHRRRSINRPILDPDLPDMAAVRGGGSEILGGPGADVVHEIKAMLAASEGNAADDASAAPPAAAASPEGEARVARTSSGSPRRAWSSRSRASTRSRRSSAGSGGEGGADDDGVIAPDDPSHLFWVPAHLHPEISPIDFRNFLKDHASRAASALAAQEARNTAAGLPSRTPSTSSASDSSASGSGTADSPPSPVEQRIARATSLTRKRSMLSRQYDPSKHVNDDSDDDPAPLRRNRSVYNSGPQLTIDDLQKLEQLAEEATRLEDPSRLRSVLRRTLSLNVAPSALEAVEDAGPEEDEADSPIIVPRPGQILRRAARTKIRKSSLSGDGGGHRFPSKRRTRGEDGQEEGKMGLADVALAVMEKERERRRASATSLASSESSGGRGEAEAEAMAKTRGRASRTFGGEEEAIVDSYRDSYASTTSTLSTNTAESEATTTTTTSDSTGAPARDGGSPSPPATPTQAAPAGGAREYFDEVVPMTRKGEDEKEAMTPRPVHIVDDSPGEEAAAAPSDPAAASAGRIRLDTRQLPAAATGAGQPPSPPLTLKSPTTVGRAGLGVDPDRFDLEGDVGAGVAPDPAAPAAGPGAGDVSTPVPISRVEPPKAFEKTWPLPGASTASSSTAASSTPTPAAQVKAAALERDREREQERERQRQREKEQDEKGREADQQQQQQQQQKTRRPSLVKTPTQDRHRPLSHPQLSTGLPPASAVRPPAQPIPVPEPEREVAARTGKKEKKSGIGSWFSSKEERDAGGKDKDKDKDKDKESGGGGKNKAARAAEKERERERREEEKAAAKEEKEKSGFLGSLFGKKKADDSASSSYPASASSAHHQVHGGGSSASSSTSINIVRPSAVGAPSGGGPAGQPRPYTNFARYPIHVERALYRLSHIKLANPRRPLVEQVLISNLMFWYLSIINRAQQQAQQQQQLLALRNAQAAAAANGRGGQAAQAALIAQQQSLQQGQGQGQGQGQQLGQQGQPPPTPQPPGQPQQQQQQQQQQQGCGGGAHFQQQLPGVQQGVASDAPPTTGAGPAGRQKRTGLTKANRGPPGRSAEAPIRAPGYGSQHRQIDKDMRAAVVGGGAGARGADVFSHSQQQGEQAWLGGGGGGGGEPGSRSSMGSSVDPEVEGGGGSPRLPALAGLESFSVNGFDGLGIGHGQQGRR